jgi:RecJ-like exonuclease
MAMDPQFITCATCDSKGMVYGERCPTCDGQGFTRTVVPSADTPLESLKKADLVALAEARGLDSSGTKDVLIERIQAATATGEADGSEQEA